LSKANKIETEKRGVDMELILNEWQTRFFLLFFLVMVFIFVPIVLIAIAVPILKRLRNISCHEKELNNRIIFIKSKGYLMVSEAVDLERDLGLLLDLFRESYKINISDLESEKDSKLKIRVSRWCHVRSHIQNYLEKEITFSDLKCLI
jgi:hypothetical protein